MEPAMIYFQRAYELVMFIIRILPSIALFWLGRELLEKHDWRNAFFKDRWGTLGITSFLLAIIVFLVLVYLPSWL